MIKPRCRSVFENYQQFQAWQDSSQQNFGSLLQRLNTNLNIYENKYKKYMNFHQNEIRNSRKLQSLLPPLEKHQENLPTPPILQPKIQQVTRYQNINTQKVLISQQKQLKQSDIFCQRTNLFLKHKTLCFQKNSKPSNSLNRRKLSGHDKKDSQIEKILLQSKKNRIQQKENLLESRRKLEPLKKYDEGYKKLRYRLKKAANKSKLYHEDKIFQFKDRNVEFKDRNVEFKDRNLQSKDKQNNGNLILKRRTKNIRQSVQLNIQYPIEQKINQFSDKKFYESNLKQRYFFQR